MAPPKPPELEGGARTRRKADANGETSRLPRGLAGYALLVLGEAVSPLKASRRADAC